MPASICHLSAAYSHLAKLKSILWMFIEPKLLAFVLFMKGTKHKWFLLFIFLFDQFNCRFILSENHYRYFIAVFKFDGQQTSFNCFNVIATKKDVLLDLYSNLKWHQTSLCLLSKSKLKLHHSSLFPSKSYSNIRVYIQNKNKVASSLVVVTRQKSLNRFHKQKDLNPDNFKQKNI